MNTGKLGLSFGEKFALWMYGKVSQYSKNNLTHLLLLFAIILYCVVGGIAFYVIEGERRSEMTERNIKNDNDTINDAIQVCIEMRHHRRILVLVMTVTLQLRLCPSIHAPKYFTSASGTLRAL